MADKMCKTTLRYMVVLILLQSSMAGLLPDALKWIESDNGHWSLDKKSTTKVNYWLRIKEGQSVIDENIRIDTGKQTEQFHVLAYDSVDEAIMLSDFKKNLTIIKLPKKNQCFLQALNPVTPPPQKLMANIQKAIALNGTNSTINIDIKEKSSWKAKSVPFNRLLLTAEMRKLCLNVPVYEITRVTGQVYVKGFQRQGRSSKYPRSACGGYVCSYYWQWYCPRIVNNQCVWVKVRVYGCQEITC